MTFTKRSLSLYLSIFLVLEDGTDAFTVLRKPFLHVPKSVMRLEMSSTTTKSTTTPTSANDDAWSSFSSRIIKAGGGIPVVPSGNNGLFDPDKEGKIGDTSKRVDSGINFHFEGWPVSTDEISTSSLSDETLMMDAQHWLEDIGIPSNFAKPTNPVEATVLGRVKLIGDDAPGDIQHVMLRLPAGMHYVEGQSLSVIPPGVDSNGRRHKPRLYSIASTRYGDLLSGDTVSLCVRRAEYYDPTTGQLDSGKAGVCSSFLCDTQPGDIVDVAGPVGKALLLPEDLSKDLIMVATGTGVAPFRSFLHRLFVEQTVARHMFTGQAWLILGVPVTSGLLYAEEFSSMMETTNDPAKLRIDYAISREMTNAQGGKLYVQDILAENADLLLEKLEGGAVIYFCGLKGMMPGLLDSLEKVYVSRGMNFTEKLKQYKDNHQWHVEVY